VLTSVPRSARGHRVSGVSAGSDGCARGALDSGYRPYQGQDSVTEPKHQGR